MKSPKVTVVVPTHNRPELMYKAVQSVVGQDYDGPIEIIIIFDACDVLLPDVRLPPRRTLLGFANTRTRGLAGARNTGILKASSEFVAFLDDDDYWFSDKLSQQMNLMEKYPDTMFVGSAMMVERGAKRYERLLPGDVIEHDQLIHNRLAGLHSSSFVFRIDALIHQIGLIDEDLPGSYGEDYDVLLRTAKLAPIRVVNKPLLAVRWSGQSYFFGKWLTYADGLSYLLRKHPAFAGHRKSHSRINSQIAFSLAAGREHARARSLALKSLKDNPANIKALMALGISCRLLSAEWVIRTVQSMGKGI